MSPSAGIQIILILILILILIFTDLYPFLRIVTNGLFNLFSQILIYSGKIFFITRIKLKTLHLLQFIILMVYQKQLVLHQHLNKPYHWLHHSKLVWLELSWILKWVLVGHQKCLSCTRQWSTNQFLPVIRKNVFSKKYFF